MLTARQVKGQVILAIAIPAIFGLLYITMLLHAAHATMVNQFALLILLYFSILVVELRCAHSLWAVLRAGLSIERARIWLNDPVRVQRRNRRWFRAAAVILSVVFSLILAEIVFRVFQIHSPSAQLARIDAQQVDNRLNSLGLRESWDWLSEDDPRLRIAFLGDSFTYGEAVEPRDCFCHLVEEMLQSALPRGVVTINLGVPGSGPSGQLELYRRVAPALRPDIVVQVIYPNDLGIELAAMLERIYRLRDARLFVPQSYVLSFVEKQIRYKLAWNRTIDYFRGGGNESERRRSWNEFESQVKLCKSAVEESGAVYVMFLFPWLARLDAYLLAEVHESIKGLASELGVPYLDLLEVFRGQHDSAMRISSANEHPNPLAHRLAAERISLFLREHVLPTLAPN